jgi:hypothetical protein
MSQRVAMVVLTMVLATADLAGTTSEFGGPARISRDHRHFVDGRDRAVFWLGDTEWELFLRLTEREAQAVLEDRRLRGFNAIQVMLLGSGGGKKANRSGARPFVDDDVSRPNEAYFAAVDTVVRIAAAKNLALVVGVYHQAREYGTMITTRHARAWGRWLGRRYRLAPNIIWSMYPSANASYVALLRELVAGLTEGDGGSHLITVHPDPGPASSSWIHQEAWLSFNTVQTWKSTYLNYQMVAADYARTPVKPVVNGEARYETESGTTPLNIRNGAYWSCLAGGYYSFGHGGNWLHPGDWEAWIDSPATRQMQILGAFFRSIDWWNLVPDPRMIAGNAGEMTREIIAARSSKHEWGIVYLPASATVRVDLGAVSAGRSVEASWMNPATGGSRSIGTFPAARTRLFTSPMAWEDAVLVLRARP